MSIYDTSLFCHLADDENIHEVNRRHRRDVAQHFASGYSLEPVRQYIVRSTGPETLSDQMYYGVKLVAVYGMDSSICVVTKRNELDMRRVLSALNKRPKHVVICQIAEAAVSDVEGHAFDGDCEMKPFGFVSIPVSVTMKSDEESGQAVASSSEYDEEKVIDFLTSKMQSGLASTFDETIKTAISGFKHLCQKELKAEELWVSAWHGHSPAQPLRVNEIQYFLDIINGVSGRSAPSLDSLESQMDSDAGTEVYSYVDSDVESYMEDSDVNMDPDRFATYQELDECDEVLSKKISEYKNVLLPRRYDSISFKIGGYAIEDVSITCVGSSGTHCWLEESYGLMWVVVHGLNSICMVARHDDLDMTRVGPFFKGASKDVVMNALTTAVVSDIEDFPDEKHESLGLSIKVPFGVVSVNPGIHCEHAVTFLQENIRDGLTFTVEETIQTAISAFMLLCLEEVKLEDIYVSSCRELGGRTVSLSMNEIKQYCPLSMRSRIILPIKNST